MKAAILHLRELIDAYDRRYEERFLAQEKALEIGLTAQKEALSVALSAADRAVAAAMASAEKATLKADAANAERFDHGNKFRETIDRYVHELLPRAEATAILDSQGQQISELKSQITVMTSERAGIKGGWALAVGAVGFVLWLSSQFGLSK